MLAVQVADDDIMVLFTFKHISKHDLNDDSIILQELITAAVQFNEEAKVSILLYQYCHTRDFLTPLYVTMLRFQTGYSFMQ